MTAKSGCDQELPSGITLEHEVIVIGTGFGGAVAACRLAQAGLKPLILERGRRYEKDDFPALPADGALVPDLRRWTWGEEQGLWDVQDLEEIISIQAAGFGGGSLLYANVHLRPPASVFDQRWPDVYQEPGALDRYFELAGYMLDAAPIGKTITSAEQPITPPTKTRQLELVAEKLDRRGEFFHPPLTIARKDGLNDHGRYQRACIQCGKCCTGCPEEAKNTLDFNYLAEAERPEYHARVMTECEVTELEELEAPQDVKDAAPYRWKVFCIDHLTARTHCFRARYVFLCAGSVHTTRLLLKSNLNRAAKSLVGVGYFPGGGAVGVVHDTTCPQYPSEGPTITTTTVHWDSVDPASFFLIQDGGYARELERLIGMFRAPAWLGRNRVTSKGKSTLAADDGPRPDRPEARPRASPPLPSPIDAVLDALSAGSFTDVVPGQLRARMAGFLKEVQKPMLLPQIVERTIDVSLDAHFAEASVWKWLRWWPGMLRPLKRLMKRLAYFTFGSPERIADRALRALLLGANLPRSDWTQHILGYDAEKAEQRTMLLAMGRDAAHGVLLYDRKTERLTADLDLFHLAPRYGQEEQLMADFAKQLGGELRTSPAWAFLGKPITVHNQGGCPMSKHPTDGVTDPNGKVHCSDGLYILDGAALCTSVGVNPSATITAIAERNIEHFIRSIGKVWPDRDDRSSGAVRYVAHLDGAAKWAKAARDGDWKLEPPRPATPPSKSTDVVSRPLGLTMCETLDGYFAATVQEPEGDAAYRALETLGRPANPVALSLTMLIQNLAVLYEDQTHEVRLRGTARLSLPGTGEGSREHEVEGRLELFVRRYKPNGASPIEEDKLRVQRRLAGSNRTLQRGPAPGQTRLMRYDLAFPERPGWSLRGYKRIRDDPGLDAWRDTTSLFFTLLGPDATRTIAVRAGGVAHMDLPSFAFGQLPSLKVGYAKTADPFDLDLTEDPAQVVWATAKFSVFFFGSLQRIYLPESTTALDAFFRLHPSNVRRDPPGTP